MTRKSLHLKRFAATSLCLVMCLSALPMLAPSASALEDVTPLATSTGRGGTICITFDDVSSTVYDYAYPVLADADITATAFVIAGRIGGQIASRPERYMNLDELREVEAAGWEIGSHGVNHLGMATLTEEEIRYELSESREMLTQFGFDVTTFAYPFGSLSDYATSIGAEYYDRMRTTEYTTNMFLHDYPSSRLETGVIDEGTWEQTKRYIDKAVRTDTTAIFLLHWIMPDGTVEGTDYNIQTLADYLVEMREQYGTSIVNYRDLPNARPDADIYVYDGEGADSKASTAANWVKYSHDGTITNDVLPTDGCHILWNGSAGKGCTFDLTVKPHSWTTDRTFKWRLAIGGLDVLIGPGGAAGNYTEILGHTSGRIICEGDWVNLKPTSSVRLALEGMSHVRANGQIYESLEFGGIAHISDSSGNFGSFNLNVSEGATISIEPGSYMRTIIDTGSHVSIDGRITGGGEYVVQLRVDGEIDVSHISTETLSIVTSAVALSDAHASIVGEMDQGVGRLMMGSKHATYDLAVSIDGCLIIDEMSISSRVTMSGSTGTIIATHWDSTACTWIPEQSTVVLRDGGTVKLAPGQSFNKLQIASDDGRTASWTMTAIGAQAPVVTGLKAGKDYIWSIDGVEQGEVKADKDGTIALSYQSTGLHELSVGPGPMTIAMDGVYQAVGIVAVLAVLGGLITMVGRLKF